MPWKAPSTRTARQRSVRGRISAPIPASVTEHTDDEFPMRHSRATVLRHDEPGGATPDAPPPDADPPRVAPQPDHAPAAREPPQDPHRPRSTLKTALNKLLGRHKKPAQARTSDSVSVSAPAPAPAPAPDPGPDRNASAHSTDRPLFPKHPQHNRYASMPITEYDRALRSHSISPEDVLAIQSARNSLNTESRQSGKKPGASDAVSAHSPPRWSEPRRFTGLTPRPASSHHRRPRLADWSEDPDEIISPIPGQVKALRRRSRSLSAIPANDGAYGPSRRRSDEIRHWRESYDPAAADRLSVPAGQFDDTASQIIQELDATSLQHEPPKSPAQPFTFAHISSMKEAAGLKITEAASLGSRVSILEVRMSRLEDLVVRVAKALPGFALPADSCAPTETDAADALPDMAAEHGSQDEAMPVKSTDASKTGGSPRSTLLLSHSASSSASRPLSMTTVRGAVSSLAQDPGGAVTPDHYLALASLLEAERSAREVLEMQVKRLGHQINLATKLAGYARPAAGDLHSADESLRGASAFEDDVDDQDGRWLDGTDKPLCSVAGPEGSSAAARDKDQDGDAESFADSFTTPNEDRSEDERDGDFRTAARALSLSRLTLGSGTQHRMHRVSSQAL